MVEAPTGDADAWALAAPWCRALQGRLRLRCDVQYMQRTPSKDKRWELHVALPLVLPHDDLVSRGAAASTEGDITAMRELREALELLSVIAVVDNEAWRRLLASCITVDRHEGDQSVPDTSFPFPPLRFRLDERDAEFEKLVYLLDYFFVMAEKSPTSEKFIKVRRKVFAMLSAHDRGECPVARALLEQQELRVPFNVELFPTRSGEAFVTALDSVFRTLRAVEECARTGRRTLDEIDRGFLTSYVLQSRTLFAGAIAIGPRLARALVGKNRGNGSPADDQVKRFLPTCGLDGWSMSLNADVQLPMALVAHIFRHIVDGGIKAESVNLAIPGENPVSRCGCKRTLSLMFDSTSSWKFRCAMSALVGARATDMLTLDGMFEAPDITPAAQRLKWQWLAFALFSKASAGSSITHVVLDDLRITPSDVDAISAVLRTSQPEPRTIATHSDATPAAVTQTDYVRVFPSAILCMQPPSVTEESGGTPQQSMDSRPAQFSLESDQASCWFQVLDEAELSAHCVSILVPGYGKCAVPRSSIAATNRHVNAAPAVLKTGEVHRPGGSVRSLSLSFDHDIDGAVLPRLLHLIGHSLEYLSIVNVGCRRWHHHLNDTNDGVNLAWLATACPNLRHLRLANSHVQLDSLIGATKVCELKILELHYCYVSTQGVCRFARSLSDVGSQLAMHLTELSLHCCDESRRGLGQSVAEAFKTMLSSNSRLRFLRLWISRQVPETHAARLQAFDAQPLAVERDALPLACKLAFLTCIATIRQPTDRTDADAEQTAAVPALHEDVLREIFAFAAACEERRVVVAMT